MQLHNLKRNTNNRKAKQVGRGGTRGKTSGRGTKGQNARSGRKKRPEMRDIIKKIPKLRGRGRNFLKSRFPDAFAVNLKEINIKFAAGETVNSKTLAEKGILKSTKNLPIKILNTGKLEKALTFEKVSVSENAKKAIEAVGGKIKNE